MPAVASIPGFARPETHPNLDWTPLRVSQRRNDADAVIQLRNPGAWYETNGRIIDKYKKLIQPGANTLQKRVFKAVIWCLDNGVPIRLILLKPRQKGCSTVSMAVIYWLMNRFENFKGCVIGREYSQSNNLWKIFRTYSANDKFDWGFDRTVLDTVSRFGNGSALEKETAGDSEAGRSGTFHAVVATEAARWREKGVANAEDVLNGLLNCVPYLPGTCIIEESTAYGASGAFYETWEDAVDFEEYVARHERGESLEGRMIRVFAGWHEFEDSVDVLTDQQEAWLRDDMTVEERDMMERLAITPGHISWRRRTIRTECQRDLKKFDREFPETPAHAFRASAPSRFNATGLTIMRQEARQRPETWGTLEMQGAPKPNHRLYNFVPMEKFDATARIIVIEPPTVGFQYILAVDTMEGIASDDKGEKLDHHAAIVLRRGRFDPVRGWQKPRVAARTVLAPKKGINCWWDMDILEEWVWRLAQYYGDCMIVPESNKEGGLIRGLVKRGAILYESETNDKKGDIRSPKRSGEYGFRTTGGEAENTRSWIIENLAKHIREWDQPGLGIDADERTIHELENFILVDGRAEAIAGEHDDSVITLAIALALVESATTLRPPVSRAPIPEDLRNLERRKRPRGQYR